MRAPFKTKRIDAGKYRTEGIVEEPFESKNAMYEVILAPWRTFAVRRFAEQPTSGREFQAAMTIVPSLRSILKTRSDSESRAITPRMRILIGGRLLSIDSVYDDGGERREVVIWCIEEAVV